MKVTGVTTLPALGVMSSPRETKIFWSPGGSQAKKDHGPTWAPNLDICEKFKNFMCWVSFFQKKIIFHKKGDDITRFDGSCRSSSSHRSSGRSSGLMNLL